MGSYSSFAFDMHVNVGRSLLGDGIDDLQSALATAAPHWASRVTLTSVGRWHVGVPIDMTVEGRLGETLRMHLPGGAKWREPVQPAWWAGFGGQVVLTGRERTVHVSLSIPASLGLTDADDAVSIGTTRPQTSDQPASDWVARVFEAICARTRPVAGSARPFGEAMARRRRYGERALSVNWLTYLGVARSELAELDSIPGLIVKSVGDGTLIRLAEAWGDHRRSGYWRRAEAVDNLISDQWSSRLLARGFDHTDQLPPPPKLIVPGIRVHRGPLGLGRPEVIGTRLSGLRVGGEGFDAPGGLIRDFDVDHVQFDNVSLGAPSDSVDPVIVRNCRMRMCRVSVVILRPTIFEDCEIDGLKGSPFMTAEILLRHVTLKGSIDSIDIRAPRQVATSPAIENRHRAHYATVDWALDIRDARFARCDIAGVPGRLVRRDPATQILVTVERVAASSWQDVVRHSTWETRIRRLLDGGLDSEVFVACPRGRTYAADLEAFAGLRESGIAEPD